MVDKKSFVLYCDSKEQWDMLTDEQAGRLVKALFDYVNNGDTIQTSDGMLRMAFSFIVAQIDRDTEKYNAVCKKRKDAIEKRWKQKNTKDTNVYKCIQENTEDTNVYKPIQTYTNDTDNDNVTENETVNVNDNVTVTDENNIDIIFKERKVKERKDGEPSFFPTPTKSKERKRFVKPTVEEVKAYCEERGNSIDAEKFVAYYESNGWKVGKNSMKDWKAAVRTWEKNDYGDRSRAGSGSCPQSDGFNVDVYKQFINKF